ncbi:hypothetical protein [Methylocystis parvus]|uniref:Uncharacterized protein n=1 Tax=Methylocystis parvus TaxID=134 RepID=A0A6B8M4Y9_9HYPH|nr:hypothetical protein [Methylocystis parvus]QGM97405.1 hypothetical protein F7D14_07920 [Methylocystis parvus]WBJ98682.1 hypothetical protein MMG94_11690 [Methylocystis parvus OBBP]
MARFGHESGKVICLNVERRRFAEEHLIADVFVVLLFFLIATCLAAELLSRAFAAWIGAERIVALSFVTASGFL